MGRSRVVAAIAAVVISAVATPALAQTWAGGRKTPGLGEMFAVDKTGESGWLYGQEDVAGDGLGSFKQQEQSIDIRTAYAATDAQRLWLRVYVSSAAAPGGNVTAFFFIDSDASPSTGGSAAATSIDAKFTQDTSPGGYEYVLGVRGNASIVGLWHWQMPQAAWTSVQLKPNEADAESGTDLDPIRLDGNTHGYLQGAVNLSMVELTQACDARLYVRSVNDVAALGAGDLEVGQVGACVPNDANNNGVPDPLEPPSGCTSNAQCPANGVCVSGKCVIAQPCTTNADCPAAEQCTPDGRCVPKPSGNCTTNADCSDLVCTGGQCVACTAGGAQCGTGKTCAPTGHCVTGTAGGAGGATGAGGAGDGGVALEPGESVKGGACSCSLPGRPSGGPLTFALALLLPLGWTARRSRRRRQP